MTAAVSFRDVAVAYRGVLALDDVSGAFTKGSMTAVVGPNGAGKSTLLRAISGDLAPTRGAIERSDRSHIAYLPQAAEIDRRFPITVADVALLGLWREIGAFRRPSADHKRRLGQALETVGLSGLEGRLVGDLSVGQFQRALFARLILQDADLVLLDEPFAAIDTGTADDLLAIVTEWHAAGRTIVAVLHDLHQVRRTFPEALLLARRPIAWGATDRVLTAANIARARMAIGGRQDEHDGACFAA